ncbi:Hypothetical protein, putative [Bodo saltans]|uniref:GmrSD restriction endonucleases N-terminal domain-containing protein n=1 Tax=Bodo saltans TaxID=75058 RepID=A0A0S4IYY2_BODSA|nr:Hypothetical protein, putative [Bodo saltans]|eukprot:CUG61050.1 Hypothetical protein, putative [Bodo saltans]
MQQSNHRDGERKAISFVGLPEAHSSSSRLTPKVVQAETPNGLGLLHGPGGCPGFTGGEARQSIRPRSFRQFLQDDADQIVIPLFQRKYCWQQEQGVKWFADLRQKPKKNGWQGCHNTGKAIFKPTVEGGRRSFVCVDGQQRITTTMLLQIAVRDAASRLDLPDALSNVKVLTDPLLFVSDGSAQPMWKLVPSLADRYTYASLISGSVVGNDELGSTPNEHLIGMKQTFDACIATTLAEVACDEDKLTLLTDILRQSVDEMYLVSIEIQNDPDLAQVFLWLQEKSLLGMGALLQNLAPGVEFHAADLVRNILFAPFMRKYGLGSDALASCYKTLWLLPIEAAAGTPAAVDALIDKVLASWYSSQNGSPEATWVSHRHYVSPYEQRIVQMIEWFRSSGVLKYSTDGIERYARFLTFVDDFAPKVPVSQAFDVTAPIASPEEVARALLSCIARTAGAQQ